MEFSWSFYVIAGTLAVHTLLIISPSSKAIKLQRLTEFETNWESFEDRMNIKTTGFKDKKWWLETVHLNYWRSYEESKNQGEHFKSEKCDRRKN